MRRSNFMSSLFGAVVGVLVMAAFPAMAAQVGDALELGRVNSIQQRTTLTGSVQSQSLKIFNNHPSGEALRLDVEPGNAPLKVNSSKRVKNLNADLLDNRHASHLIRAAYGATNDAPDANGDAVTATIIAPRRGILIMNGGVDVDGSTFDEYFCRLMVDGEIVTGSQRISVVHWPGDHTDNHTGNHEEDCSTEGAKIVDAGPHTVSFNIEARDTAGLYGSTVWVIWVPFDGNGQVPPR